MQSEILVYGKKHLGLYGGLSYRMCSKRWIWRGRVEDSMINTEIQGEKDNSYSRLRKELVLRQKKM